MLGQLGAEGGDQRIRLLTEGNHAVGAEPLQFFEPLWIAPGGDDAARPEALGDLYGKLTGHSGCAENEDALPGGELGPPGKRNPRRHPWVCDSSRSHVVQSFG